VEILDTRIISIMNIELIDAHHPEAQKVLDETYPLLSNLDLYYPSISVWFAHSFRQGLTQGKNVLLAARAGDGRLLGVALGKKTQEEVKMQCVRVLDPVSNSGIGIKLMDRMLETLDTTKPLATVSEEMLHAYSRIFVKRYGFSLVDVAKGAYRPRKLEYYFNGTNV
jgi:hypothetical protein